ncbi:MAG: addiction module protein [Pyrinomonadaceae bacterium]
MNTLVAEIMEMSVSDRLRIVEDIWDSIASDAKDLKISEELKSELDRRLEAYESDPDAGVTWDELDTRLAGL